MGMYTGLRCKAIIKKEYIEELNRILANDLEWTDSNIDFLKEYGNYSRSDFIPEGFLIYMPAEWEDEDGLATDGFEHTFNAENGLWSFQCSLKDYDNTIKYFFDNVLSKIAERIIHLEEYFEDSIFSTSYKLVEDKIVEDKCKFIKYKYDYEYDF